MKKVYNGNRRSNYEELTVCITLEAFMGTGGGNVPIVLDFHSPSEMPSHGNLRNPQHFELEESEVSVSGRTKQNEILPNEQFRNLRRGRGDAESGWR